MLTQFSERLELSEENKNSIIYEEHLVRYFLAIQFAQNKAVLDIACGSGYGARMLKNRGAVKVAAVDISSESIRNAREKYGCADLEYIIGDAQNLEMDENQFDLAVSFETIEHIEQPEKLLENLKKTLKNNGLAIISTPNIEVSGGKNPHHLREYTKQEFSDLLGKYFKNCLILEQKNAFASAIEVSGANNHPTAFFGKGGMAEYFIALCSDAELPAVAKTQNAVGINYQAYSAYSHSLSKKILDVVYKVIFRHKRKI